MMAKIDAALDPFRRAPDERHVDVLDGIRALCVFMVGWFHIWQQSWLIPSVTLLGQRFSLDFLPRTGYLYVDGLLLLSGFLLYLPYTRPSARLPGIRAFYKRRLIRILPSYLLCVIPLFILACVRGQYASAGDAAKDLLAHLTFTHTLFPSTYYGSPINGALWTLGVEMQFYLLFPFLARAFRKAPVPAYLCMAGAGLAFRLLVCLPMADVNMYFNQLPAFLDVYANGFLAAMIFASLRRKLGRRPDSMIRLFFTFTGALCVWLLGRIAQNQASYVLFQGSAAKGQLLRRFPFSAVLACLMVCAAFSLPAARLALGGRVMRFLASVSFQFYLYHQTLSVWLKEWKAVPSAVDAPWMTGNYPWQLKYTLLCFLSSLALAALITYLFERPIARALRKKTNAEPGENMVE